MLEFIAFDVEEGDSFLIKKGDKQILIDGGKDSSNLFPNKIKNLNINKLDLIVCTHADTDHAQGLINLLKSNVLNQCDMIWMPAKWKKHIQILKEQNSAFIPNLLEEIKKVDISEELIEEYIQESINEKDEKEPRLNVDDRLIIGYPYHVADDIEASPPENLLLSRLFKQSLDFNEYSAPIYNWSIERNYNFYTPKQFGLFRKVLHTYGKLIELIEVANHRGIPITWFDYVRTPLSIEDYNRFREDDLLTPLCHRPIAEIDIESMPDPNILEMLPKYSVNKDSIVLASKNTEDLPLVIISSDSDFEKIDWLPSSEAMLITVPHHGSANNIEAFNKCLEFSLGKNPILVRGDSNRISMSDEFIASRHDYTIYCTICRKWNSKGPNGTKIRNKPQTIHMHFQDKQWSLINNPISCKCEK
ncbi:MBL fold metallo-hydrolase [Rossellomorea vietnamensis]|uniref:MBL fold metallo-hydrolase n=1 Tax=Rossellomorea vietnamensis TaxID=218284 RepID=UPI003CEC5408